MSECIEMANLSSIEITGKNYFPRLPDDDLEYPAMNAYRALGMASLLDVEYGQGQSEVAIKIYYEGILQNLKDRTLCIAMDDQRRPIGYATWNADEHNQACITLTRQSAPFGDHIKLQKKLKNIFPNQAIVTSRHERSSRRDQIAW